MTNKTLAVGVIGTLTAILCCVTPFLPWLLGVVGLSGLAGDVYRDSVLLPLAAFFLTLTGYALWEITRAK